MRLTSEPPLPTPYQTLSSWETLEVSAKDVTARFSVIDPHRMMQTCDLTDGFVRTGIIALTYGQVSVNATRCRAPLPGSSTCSGRTAWWSYSMGRRMHHTPMEERNNASELLVIGFLRSSATFDTKILKIGSLRDTRSPLSR